MTGLRSRIADLLGRPLFASGLHRRLDRGGALVALFHRVVRRADDNPLTVGLPAFEAYCDFLAERFHVIGLSELVDRLEAGREVAGCAVITFDDGYLDNHTLARPVLEERGLPACFFIATGFIGTDRVAWWDREQGVEPPWMGWEQVADLAERGFELGGHTRNHVDLGQVEGRRAEDEIRSCARDLEERTGSRPVHFSFPYGRRENVTEENRALVEEAGYASCSSAFGGTVGPGTSPFRIPRIPVTDWYLSPHHLGVDFLRQDRAAGARRRR